MKNWKRKITAVIAAVMAACVLAGCGAGALPDCFEEDAVRQSAVEAMEYFNDRDYESIIEMGSEEFKEALTAEQLAEAGDPYLDKRGAFLEITKEVFVGNTDKKTGASYASAVLIAKYEDGRIQFTIGFDEDMKLVQFYIK